MFSCSLAGALFFKTAASPPIYQNSNSDLLYVTSACFSDAEIRDVLAILADQQQYKRPTFIDCSRTDWHKIREKVSSLFTAGMMCKDLPIGRSTLIDYNIW